MKEQNLRILVVYYSLEGNTSLIAQSIAEEIGGDILKLEVVKSISSGVSKYLGGGKQVVFKEKPELIPYDFKPDNYDILFIGTPVWAWSYTPALRTFFAQNVINDKKIALFSCNGGDNGKTFENMKTALGNNEFLGEMQFLEPIKTNKNKSIESAKSWAKNLIDLI
jgi:flavodoxin